MVTTTKTMMEAESLADVSTSGTMAFLGIYNNQIIGENKDGKDNYLSGAEYNRI